MAEDRPNRVRIASYVASGAGVLTWFAYLFLRYGQQREVAWLLWTALVLVFVGFAMRSSQQST